MWILEFKLRLSGMVRSTFTYWVILSASSVFGLQVWPATTDSFILHHDSLLRYFVQLLVIEQFLKSWNQTGHAYLLLIYICVCALSFTLMRLYNDSHQRNISFNINYCKVVVICGILQIKDTVCFLQAFKDLFWTGQWWWTPLIHALRRVEAGGFLWAQGQPGLQNETETLSQKKNPICLWVHYGLRMVWHSLGICYRVLFKSCFF